MDHLFQTGLTMAHSNSLLTATGGETVYDTTVRLDYSINGKMYSKSGTNADQTTPTTDYNTGSAPATLTASTGRAVVWAYNSSGTVKCMHGPNEDLDASGNFKKAPQFPNVPDDVCPFAYQILKASSTAGTITFGTSNWNATGFTNTIVNISVLPDRPQVS